MHHDRWWETGRWHTGRGEGVTSKKLTTKNNMTMTNITGSSSCALYHQAVSRHASKVWKLMHRVKLTVSATTSLGGVNVLVSGWVRLKNVPWSHKGKKLWHAGKQRSTQQMIRAVTMCVCVGVCVYNWKPRSTAIYFVLRIVISFHISFSFWFLSCTYFGVTLESLSLYCVCFVFLTFLRTFSSIVVTQKIVGAEITLATWIKALNK